MTMKQEHKDAVSAAVEAVEKKTSAHVVTIVAPESDVLREHTFMFGLLVGTGLALILWKEQVIFSFPALLGVQLVPLALVSSVPWVHQLCLKLLPKHLVHHHAARRAYEQYISVTHALPPSAPVVLLYISLAERYVHILASHQVRDKISYDIWNKVVEKFTASMKSEGLQKSAVEAVGSMGDLLAPQFPPAK